MKKVIVCFLVLVLVGAIYAQEKKWYEGKLVAAKYDRFKDSTTLGIDRENVAVIIKWGQELYKRPCLTPLFIFKGKIPKDPSPLVRMNFFSLSESCKFLRNHDLRALVDGEPMKMPETDYQWDIKIDGSASEIISFWSSWDDFCVLCDAQVVEFQLGSEEFKAGEPEVAMWRQFREAYLDLLEKK